jgi:aminoglycoside phosphotransferase family enzyme
MYRNIDVMTEMRKLTDSKPVHAVVGAGALASQALRELPGRLVQWTRENPPHSLPARANGYVQTTQSRTNEAVQTAQSRTNEAVQTAQSRANAAVQTAQSRANAAVQTARAKAAGGYDALAARGKKAMNGQPHATEAKTTPATESKAALNGKPKGKAPSRSTTSR